MKLLSASVVDIPYSEMPKCQAVKMLFERWHYDYRQVIDPLWYGWPSKITGAISLVRELQDTDYTHLLFVDGADVVPLAPQEVVMERYLEIGHPWLFCAEQNIWSPGSFEPRDYPTPDVVYRYLNSGIMLGEIEHMARWYDEWEPIPARLKTGDQDWYARKFIKHFPEAIALDTGCKVFQTMCGSLVGDEPNCLMEPGQVYNRITNTLPVLIHFNGGDDITTPERSFLWT